MPRVSRIWPFVFDCIGPTDVWRSCIRWLLNPHRWPLFATKQEVIKSDYQLVGFISFHFSTCMPSFTFYFLFLLELVGVSPPHPPMIHRLMPILCGGHWTHLVICGQINQQVCSCCLTDVDLGVAFKERPAHNGTSQSDRRGNCGSDGVHLATSNAGLFDIGRR